MLKRRNRAMFMHGYFYWSGVVANVIVGFWVVFGIVVGVKNLISERRMMEKYARKDLKKELKK